ncbi:glucose ribitol dehydrogenase [Fusarium mundagurra]|uniref:Glucose ribitol dehydrogenase n=1 Tax=Fusarium mundagurra TaxID=1567541 RepID=A0A8H5Y0T6_9HYPO|nr:glucose ribitol dehydrogenase [Fusarium mundagurra]
MLPIKGQSLLVIGGLSGIGAAVAKLALAEGLRVAIALSDLDRVFNKVVSLKKDYPGGNITGYVADVS